MLSRQDLLSTRGPADLEVFQLTCESVPACHVYMEAQVFTPDSKRFVLHRSADAHRSDYQDPNHQYLLCDLENDGELSPLTDEIGATAPAVSPDGRWFYYFVDRTACAEGGLFLKRVGLNGRGRETLLAVTDCVPGTKYRPGRVYPLSTISSDGARIGTRIFLRDADSDQGSWGLLIHDLHSHETWMPLQGPTWFNMHPQYSRSHDPTQRYDLLVQENHGQVCHPDRGITATADQLGGDIHVIRDDGTNVRTLPWGRDRTEVCQGHQCWRGRSDHAIGSVISRTPPKTYPMYESRPVEHTGHLGLHTPEGRRKDMTAGFTRPRCYHFATDIQGRRLITDYHEADSDSWCLYLFDLPEQHAGSIPPATFLLDTHCSGGDDVHVHPFLSPDGRTSFFTPMKPAFFRPTWSGAGHSEVPQ